MREGETAPQPGDWLLDGREAILRNIRLDACEDQQNRACSFMFSVSVDIRFKLMINKRQQRKRQHGEQQSCDSSDLVQLKRDKLSENQSGPMKDISAFSLVLLKPSSCTRVHTIPHKLFLLLTKCKMSLS